MKICSCGISPKIVFLTPEIVFVKCDCGRQGYISNSMSGAKNNWNMGCIKEPLRKGMIN